MYQSNLNYKRNILDEIEGKKANLYVVDILLGGRLTRQKQENNSKYFKAAEGEQIFVR